ncbi:MAG TPA: fused MFS/spermidine synthase, partial [Bryobacteraceae bacterium]|nr:fused MFS/spermidine synthase [Bryobacteraceae bacterium]
MASSVSTPQFASSRVLFLLLLLFAGSGCSALIYEIVWFQLLQLSIGSTTVSMGFLLASFMGGLCIGSVGFARLNLSGRHPLKIYAAIEAGIAICGLFVITCLPVLDKIYFAGAAHGILGMITRGLLCAICLLPPTTLMGASLPAIVRWIETTPRGVSWWGLLYGGNTAGAVFGCLLAGFYLLRLYDTIVATGCAIAINLVVAAISYLLAGRIPAHGAVETPAEAAAEAALIAEPPAPRWPVYVTIGLSGASALGAEIVWTRLMGMLMGATVYVFSIILAVFLIGLALGSGVGSYVARIARARVALGWAQVLLALATAWSAYMIAGALPYWPIDPFLAPTPWMTFQLDMARTLWTILPPALLWGASFPLALAAVARPGEDSGKLAGEVYAANTLGSIFGALLTSLFLVPWIGTTNCEVMLILLPAVGSFFLLSTHLKQGGSQLSTAAFAVALVVIAFLAKDVTPLPGEVIAYGRRVATYVNKAQILYTVEGRNSSVAISKWGDGATEVDVNGHVEATTEPYDMKLQRMVGHLPGILHPQPKSVLGIGFGAGVSAGTFTRYPSIEHITVCEIEPVIPPTSTRYFAQADYDVYHNPKTRVVFDDARHYLLTTREQYDIIASDPLDVFVKGTAAIYSKEYFDSVKAHLKPGGMFTLYVPLYESDEATVRSELATFFAAFPTVTVWANNINGRGYDMVFMGQVDPLSIDIDEVANRLRRPDYQPVVESLRGIGINSEIDLFGTYAGQHSDLSKWTAGADINRDKDLRLQYIGGWGINSR